MNAFLKKISKLLPSIWMILFFLLFTLSISLTASECQITWIEDANNSSSVPKKELEEKIQAHLFNHSYDPIINNHEIQYEITDVFEESGIVYVIGLLSQEENYSCAVFSIQQGWLSTTTHLLYLTIDMNHLHSPTLFKDIYFLAQCSIKNNDQPFNVFIMPSSTCPKGFDYQQLWVLYNTTSSISFYVSIYSNPNGGTDFCIKQLSDNVMIRY